MKQLTITDVRTLPGDSGFLIDDGKTAILYDTGFGFTGEKLADNIKKVLGDRPLDYIFLTHSHYDHALGTPYVTRAYPGVQVVAGQYAAAIFCRGSAIATMRQLDRRVAEDHGVTEYEDLADALRVDIPVADGDRITCGDMVFTVVGLPGHTKCSVGYYLEENGLLLSTETLGVYFGQGIYLPSYLVGYQSTLDSIARVKALAPKRILLPHYGVLEQAEAEEYLQKAEQAAVETARLIQQQLRLGKTHQQVLELLEERQYGQNVATTYPVDAFHLNTKIMIELIQREFEIR